MSNYRISKVVATLTSSFMGSVSCGDYPSGSAELMWKQNWGIMVASGTTGTVNMMYGGTMNLSHLAYGTPIPCYPGYVSCSAGTVYILA